MLYGHSCYSYLFVTTRENGGMRGGQGAQRDARRARAVQRDGTVELLSIAYLRFSSSTELLRLGSSLSESFLRLAMRDAGYLSKTVHTHTLTRAPRECFPKFCSSFLVICSFQKYK
jgi:hypothetical protein